MSFSYRKLCIAVLYLQLNNAKFIATNRDRNMSTPINKRMMPAGGSIVKCIEASGGYKPLIIGKPEPLAFEMIRKEHNL
jgi:4-nitrophenyl phosphatase